MTDLMTAPFRPADETERGETVTPLIDRDHLARFTMGDRALEHEVLELFRGHSEVQIAQLKSAIGDATAWHAATHGIKGSARGVGAWELGDAAEQAERDKNAPAEVHHDHCMRLTAQFARTNRYIRGLLAS